jgi:hypothetical protein
MRNTRNPAEYYGQKNATARLEGVGGEAEQTPIFFTQTRNRGLNDSLPPRPYDAGLDSQHDCGVDVIMRISNTKVSRTAAEGEEYRRIDALLDQALELTFPCSDPVAIAMRYTDPKRPPIPEESVPPVNRSKGWRGRA